MKLREAKEILDAEVFVGHAQLDISIITATSVDPMSYIFAFAKPGVLLLTGLTNNRSSVYPMSQHRLIVIVRRKRPLP